MQSDEFIFLKAGKKTMDQVRQDAKIFIHNILENFPFYLRNKFCIELA